MVGIDRVWVEKYLAYEDEISRSDEFPPGTILIHSPAAGQYLIWEDTGNGYDENHHPLCLNKNTSDVAEVYRISTCTACKGTGIIDIGKPYPMLGSMWTNFEYCKDCNGVGGEECSVCHEEYIRFNPP